jgi:hypothetical protein
MLGLVTHTQNFINFSIIRNISNSGGTYQILGKLHKDLKSYGSAAALNHAPKYMLDGQVEIRT